MGLQTPHASNVRRVALHWILAYATCCFIACSSCQIVSLALPVEVRTGPFAMVMAVSAAVIQHARSSTGDPLPITEDTNEAPPPPPPPPTQVQALCPHWTYLSDPQGAVLPKAEGAIATAPPPPPAPLRRAHRHRHRRKRGQTLRAGWGLWVEAQVMNACMLCSGSSTISGGPSRSATTSGMPSSR